MNSLSRAFRIGIVSVWLVSGGLSTPSAVAIGELNISSQGAVTIGLTQITFTPPYPTANAITTDGTNLTYTIGTVSPGSTASLKSFNSGELLPDPDFITFIGHPNLSFDLWQVGPGMSQANCRGAKKIGDSCALADGSPFILTLTPTGTALSFSLSGVARDAGAATSVWRGLFTGQITILPGVVSEEVVRPVDIQEYFSANPAATLTSSYSAQVRTFFVP